MTQNFADVKNLANYYLLKTRDFAEFIAESYKKIPKNRLDEVTNRLSIIKQAGTGIGIAQLRVREKRDVVFLDPHASLFEMAYMELDDDELADEIITLGESIDYQISQIEKMINKS